MNKNHTISIFILSVFTVLLSVGLLIIFFKIIQHKNENISINLATLEEKINEKENAKNIQERFSEVEKIQKQIKSYFIDQSEIDIFVNYLENLGSSIGTEVSVNNVETSEAEKNIIIVKISINGTFSKVMQTISLLENSPYQIRITQIYLNEEKKEVIVETVKGNKTEAKTIQVSNWQTDVTFNILSS